MNKDENSPPSPDPKGSSVSPESGPIVQGAMVRDSTLKWFVPDQGELSAAAGQTAEELPASVSSAEDAPRPVPNQADFQGALPEPIHEPLSEDVNHRPDSLEIMISEGTVQIETDPAALRQTERAPENPENEATPPPCLSEASTAIDPAWSAITPPPKLTEGAGSPPCTSPVAVEAEASLLTPPPKLKSLPATEEREETLVTPPPRTIGSQAAVATKEPASDIAPPEASAVTPPPLVGQATPAPIVGLSEQNPVEASVNPPRLQSPMDSIDFPSPEEDGKSRSAGVLPSSEAGATPEALIRMAETAEVGEGDFEVMEPLEASREELSATTTPTSSAPPPVPARTQTPVPLSPEARASDKKTEPLPEALSRRPMKKNLKPWYEEVFDEDYLRTLPFMTAQQTLRETAFLKEALSPPPDGEILDVACGYGRHAIEFGQRGFRVTGLDLSLPLLIRAADESQRRGLSINFVHADMREMLYENQFDAAYCVLTSFGYFDEETNLRVASSICRALKPGGRFLLDVVNRDYIVSDLPSRVWWEGDGCVVLEEVDFDFHTSRSMIRRSIVFGDGRQVEHEVSIRAYSLHELGRILRRAGFQVLEVSGSLSNNRPFLGAASRQVVLVCERPLT